MSSSHHSFGRFSSTDIVPRSRIVACQMAFTNTHSNDIWLFTRHSCRCLYTQVVDDRVQDTCCEMLRATSCSGRATDTPHSAWTESLLSRRRRVRNGVSLSLGCFLNAGRLHDSDQDLVVLHTHEINVKRLLVATILAARGLRDGKGLRSFLHTWTFASMQFVPLAGSS